MPVRRGFRLHRQ